MFHLVVTASNNQLKPNMQCVSNPLTWRRWVLWPILLPATRWLPLWGRGSHVVSSLRLIPTLVSAAGKTFSNTTPPSARTVGESITWRGENIYVYIYIYVHLWACSSCARFTCLHTCSHVWYACAVICVQRVTCCLCSIWGDLKGPRRGAGVGGGRLFLCVGESPSAVSRGETSHSRTHKGTREICSFSKSRRIPSFSWAPSGARPCALCLCVWAAQWSPVESVSLPSILSIALHHSGCVTAAVKVPAGGGGLGSWRPEEAWMEHRHKPDCFLLFLLSVLFPLNYFELFFSVEYLFLLPVAPPLPYSSFPPSLPPSCSLSFTFHLTISLPPSSPSSLPSLLHRDQRSWTRKSWLDEERRWHWCLWTLT